MKTLLSPTAVSGTHAPRRTLSLPFSANLANAAPTAAGPLLTARGHSLQNISILPRFKRTETPPGISTEALKFSDALDGGAPIGGLPVSGVDGGAVGADAGTEVSPTLSVSGDTYSDSATESRKNIKFNVKLPTGADPKKYGLVNWIKGHMKKGDGNFFKVKMYGNTVDANFASSQVDSIDADPLYWSKSGSRWNYTTESDGFSATDSPGPALNTETGAEYALNFSIGLYNFADVPTTTTGTISATAIQSVGWKYSVKVDSTGKFSHPSI